MSGHDRYLERCLRLARNGAFSVAPNPMVGAVLVQGGRIIAEGWHHAFGSPHAEVECLRNFGHGPVPRDAVMYVNLEPCSHHGKTPPCADLLVERGVKRLVAGCQDPNPLVGGKGFARLLEGGIDLVTDVLAGQCRWTNRRFFTSVERQRPYVVLKWARSADGYMDDRGKRARITSPTTDTLVHRWRAEEASILVGSRTVVNDDPALTVRHMHGTNPLRVVLDRRNSAPVVARIFDGSARTLLLTSRLRTDIHVDQHVIGIDQDPIGTLLHALNDRHVRSLLVEGGAELLGHFLRSGLWDEARVITGTAHFGGGTMAPILHGTSARMVQSGPDRIDLFTNGINVDPQWPW